MLREMETVSFPPAPRPPRDSTGLSAQGNRTVPSHPPPPVRAPVVPPGSVPARTPAASGAVEEKPPHGDAKNDQRANRQRISDPRLGAEGVGRRSDSAEPEDGHYRPPAAISQQPSG